MIIATVITCPQRWGYYRKLRRNYEALKLPFPLRTFQCTDSLESPFVNNILNARSAIQYAANRLPEEGQSWLLYLEDDIRLTEELAATLPMLVDLGAREMVDCWFLCNRKNDVRRQRRVEGMVVNEFAVLPRGAHALLLPQRHLRKILTAHWGDLSDQCIFGAIAGPGAKILQVVHPVLAEHTGEISTFNPEVRQKLEINLCN